MTLYCNGVNVTKVSDYEEANPYTIRFLSPCEPGDTVITVIRKGQAMTAAAAYLALMSMGAVLSWTPSATPEVAGYEA